MMQISVDTISDTHGHGLDVTNREIYLHGYVGNTDEDPGVDYRMSTNLYKNIRILDSISQDPIIIHMHSVGGNWGDGMAIYDAILLCQSYVTIIAYGQAESMSSVILQSADNRVMTPNAYFMCHFGASEYSGNYLDVQKGAVFEKKMTDKMLDIYTDVCVKGKHFKEHYTNATEEKVRNYLKRKLKDGDWYLDANEAVYYGLADCVLNTRKCQNISDLK